MVLFLEFQTQLPSNGLAHFGLCICTTSRGKLAVEPMAPTVASIVAGAAPPCLIKNKCNNG